MSAPALPVRPVSSLFQSRSLVLSHTIFTVFTSVGWLLILIYVRDCRRPKIGWRHYAVPPLTRAPKPS